MSPREQMWELNEVTPWKVRPPRWAPPRDPVRATGASAAARGSGGGGGAGPGAFVALFAATF